MEKYVLGLDFGSDSVRAVCVRLSDGLVVGETVAFYPRWSAGMYCNQAESRYRQHPLDYIESMQQCVCELLSSSGAEVAANVVGISFDTTASTPALTDMDGTPLALLEEYSENPDAMFCLWKDHTAMLEAGQIDAAAHSSEPDYTSYCGGSYSCEWVWAKMLKCLRNSPLLRERAYSWVELGDWIGGLLTGNMKPETMARGRCFAGHKAMWNEAWGGLPPESFFTAVDPLFGLFSGHLFRDTVCPGEYIGRLGPEWAGRFGLSGEVAIAMGAIDCHAGAIAAGIRPGTLVKVVGTSTCDIAVARYEDLGSNIIRGICGQVDGSVLPGYIGLEAGQAAFGDIYAWLSRFTGRSVGELGDAAAKLSLSPKDPVSLDWFNGRRSPDADLSAQGLISGLTLATTPEMVFKSLVEATAFGSRAITETFLSEGVKIDRIIAVGGIAVKSPFVMQTLADVIGFPITVLEPSQHCAYGTAIMAACASGCFKDIQSAQASMQIPSAAEYIPDPERNRIYQTLYSKYQRLGKMSD